MLHHHLYGVTLHHNYSWLKGLPKRLLFTRSRYILDRADFPYEPSFLNCSEFPKILFSRNSHKLPRTRTKNPLHRNKIFAKLSLGTLMQGAYE